MIDRVSLFLSSILELGVIYFQKMVKYVQDIVWRIFMRYNWLTYNKKTEAVIMQKKMVAEGKRRIEILQDMGLWDEVLELWEKGTACFSKPMEMFGQVTGVTFTFNEDEELKAIKESLEKEKDFIVYYGIYDETIFGRMILFMQISSCEEDWGMERNTIKNGYADVYCYNLDERCGEYGSIGFKVANGGLIRTE